MRVRRFRFFWMILAATAAVGGFSANARAGAGDEELGLVRCRVGGEVMVVPVSVGTKGWVSLVQGSSEAAIARDQLTRLEFALRRGAAWMARRHEPGFALARQIAILPDARTEPRRVVLITARRLGEEPEAASSLFIEFGSTSLEFDAMGVARLREILAAIARGKAPVVAAEPALPPAPQPPPVKEAEPVPPPADGWNTPRPGYPFQARKMRIAGEGIVVVSTDAAGKVATARMDPGIHPLLDEAIVAYAKTSWSGPPNASQEFSISYALSE